MRKLLLSLLAFLCLSCSSKKRNPYDESDYVLVKTDSFEGMLDRKYFINKYDTTRLMINSYWNNGNILIKGFIYNGRRDGKLQNYNIDGTLLSEDSFFNGKNIYSRKYYLPDTSIKLFKDGKLLPSKYLDSFIK